MVLKRHHRLSVLYRLEMLVVKVCHMGLRVTLSYLSKTVLTHDSRISQFNSAIFADVSFIIILPLNDVFNVLVPLLRSAVGSVRVSWPCHWHLLNGNLLVALDSRCVRLLLTRTVVWLV